ncbi:MAG: spore germination protein, partial [Bacillota bacterium]
IDGVLESGYLEEYIEDTSFTLFPLMERTERPDRVAASLLEGRLAVFTEGTPFVLILPTQLSTLLQAPDDYYERLPIGSFIRVVRFIAFTMSVILPGFYVAVVSFHQELLPTVLLMRVTAFREGVPFPVVVEVLMMEFLFEVLREAGVRLPRAIGPAVSIVGALILGDAAIRAGLVSPAVVITVALTAIASFSAPVFSLAIAARLLRFIFIVLGGAFGLFGIQFGLLIMLTHLSALRSFGRPYLAPFAPLIARDLKDTLARVWWWRMTTRPKLDAFREPERQDEGHEPRV